MSESEKFDPATPFAYRSLDEAWLGFSDPEERRKRDLYLAPTRAEFEAELERNGAACSRSSDAPKCPRVTYLGVIPESSVVSLDHAGKLFQRRPDLFESDDDTPTVPPRRPTTSMRRKDFYQLYEAVLYANYLGCVMNFELSICWQRGGFAMPDDVEIAFSGFIERFRKFCGYWETPAYYYAVFENGATVGYHSHIHLHFPHVLQPKLIQWLQSTLETPAGGPFPRAYYDWKRHKDDSTVSQWMWFSYAVKALDPSFTRVEQRAREQFKTFNEAAGVRCKPTGPLVIKRVRLAREIAEDARRKRKFRVHNMFVFARDRRFGSEVYLLGMRDREADGAS